MDSVVGLPFDLQQLNRYSFGDEHIRHTPAVLSDLIGALLRILYDALFWARNLPEGGRLRPLMLVLEEAHAYLGKEHVGTAPSAVRRIAKEGRKYGVGVMIVSQRPSEIDPTILSQCGTIFAMRLANDIDRGQITGAASDNLKGLFDMPPILRTTQRTAGRRPFFL